MFWLVDCPVHQTSWLCWVHTQFSQHLVIMTQISTRTTTLGKLFLHPIKVKSWRRKWWSCTPHTGILLIKHKYVFWLLHKTHICITSLCVTQIYESCPGRSAIPWERHGATDVWCRPASCQSTFNLA